MKKLLTILLAAVLILSGLALPRSAAAEEKTPEQYGFRTLGDAEGCESPGYAVYEGLFVLIVSRDGAFYRLEAQLSPQMFETLMDLDIFDDDHDANIKKAVRDLPVTAVINLSEALLSRVEMDALVGCTGQELTDMGFVPQGSYGFWEDGTLIYLVKGPFVYEVTFAEVLEPEDDPNLVEVMAPLTVKSMAFLDVSSYASELDFDLYGSPEYVYFAPPAFPIPEIAVADSPFATLADAFALRGENCQSALSEALYVLVLENDGAYYRVEAELAPDVVEEANAIDFFDEARDEKLDALLAPLPVTRVGDISACLPTAAELDELVGLTGQELLDMGFAYGMGYSFQDKAELYLTKDLFEYHFYFSETVPEREDYDEVLDEIMGDLTVERAEIFGLSQICSDPELIW